MPAEEPKSQHFIHRAYLEGFQDPALLREGRRALWLYMVGKNPVPQAPERVAKRNYYYCYREKDERQFLVEHTLQKLEDSSLPILIKLKNVDLALSPEERVNFAGYIALSYTRVPAFERAVNKITELNEARRLEYFATNRSALNHYSTNTKLRPGRSWMWTTFRGNSLEGILSQSRLTEHGP
jgi:hypothetical protein